MTTSAEYAKDFVETDLYEAFAKLGNVIDPVVLLGSFLGRHEGVVVTQRDVFDYLDFLIGNHFNMQESALSVVVVGQLYAYLQELGWYLRDFTIDPLDLPQQ